MELEFPTELWIVIEATGTFPGAHDVAVIDGPIGKLMVFFREEAFALQCAKGYGGDYAPHLCSQQEVLLFLKAYRKAGATHAIIDPSPDGVGQAISITEYIDAIERRQAGDSEG